MWITWVLITQIKTQRISSPPKNLPSQLNIPAIHTLWLSSAWIYFACSWTWYKWNHALCATWLLSPKEDDIFKMSSQIYLQGSVGSSFYYNDALVCLSPRLDILLLFHTTEFISSQRLSFLPRPTDEIRPPPRLNWHPPAAESRQYHWHQGRGKAVNLACQHGYKGKPLLG